MFKFLKEFWHLMLRVTTERLIRKQHMLSIFDLVSRVPDPTPKDLYMVYSFSDEDVYLVRWIAYNWNGVFDAAMDKQVVYNYWQARDNLYKVSNYSIQPYSILANASVRELRTFAVRLNHVFGANLPLMGLFVDPHDKHLMLVAYVTGSVETGTAIVYDLTTAPSAGISHAHQISHVVRIRDIINNHTLRPFDVDDLVWILKQSWRKEVIHDLTVKLFDAIRTTEVKHDKFAIYCHDMTRVVPPEEFASISKPTTKQQIKDKQS